MSFRDEIRKTMPKLAARAERGAKPAIRLFCIECMGGNKRDAKHCQTRDCFLWPHRGAGWSEKPGSVGVNGG